METVRMNITVDEDIPALLAKLAGGKRLMGQWLTELLRDIEAGKIVKMGEVIDSGTIDLDRDIIMDQARRLDEIEKVLRSYGFDMGEDD